MHERFQSCRIPRGAVGDVRIENEGNAKLMFSTGRDVEGCAAQRKDVDWDSKASHPSSPRKWPSVPLPDIVGSNSDRSSSRRLRAACGIQNLRPKAEDIGWLDIAAGFSKSRCCVHFVISRSVSRVAGGARRRLGGGRDGREVRSKASCNGEEGISVRVSSGVPAQCGRDISYEY